MKKVRVYVYTPSYDENSGGRIALHRLCHLLNQTEGFEAFLVPRKLEKVRFKSIKELIGSFWQYICLEIERCYKFKTHPTWNTPVKKLRYVDDKNAIVVYPEITFGNPLFAKNVIRWFLHQPGHLKGEFNYGVGELYFKFNSAIKDFIYCKSKTSNNNLKVIYYPLDIYNDSDITVKDIQSHLVRKGKDKPKVHNDSSIPIDGLSHSQIAKIMKRSEIFISYDDYTAYSIFAVLCDCKSVVVPGKDVLLSQWYPNESDRYGIAYGFTEEQYIWASKTKHKVLEHIKLEHQKSQDSVIVCFNEARCYFNI
ncbi:WavQ [Shewanella basaltis]|uniref:WavQ n=1 Tax=Shewanella basaltis TaxID=472183 RepID=UPI0020104BB0|nr:WavQ [Shewanella basaltis]MCL1112991.1 WavQ [Shewanella basaltis]